MKIIKVTVPLAEVERAIIERARLPLYMRPEWPSRVTARDAWGDWEVTFTEPEPPKVES